MQLQYGSKLWALWNCLHFAAFIKDPPWSVCFRASGASCTSWKCLRRPPLFLCCSTRQCQWRWMSQCPVIVVCSSPAVCCHSVLLTPTRANWQFDQRRLLALAAESSLSSSRQSRLPLLRRGWRTLANCQTSMSVTNIIYFISVLTVIFYFSLPYDSYCLTFLLVETRHVGHEFGRTVWFLDIVCVSCHGHSLLTIIVV